jgi:nucleotide sugar dehydrogenase
LSIGDYLSLPRRVAVVGLGKIGLPLAVQFASRGMKVVGVDLSSEVVERVNSGLAHFSEAGMAALLREAVESGGLIGTTDLQDAVRGADYIVVVVPLYVDSGGEPDFSNIDQAIAEVGKNLDLNATVIIETTLPIGTTRTRFAPILEKESGLIAGKDFFVAFSPERVSSGTVFADFRRYPKLVGGVNPESTARAAELYKYGLEFDMRPDLVRTNGVWGMDSADAAEFAKLAETTFRDVNIALANTFANHAEELGISYAGIREACNSQPFSMLHSAGISVGGHCIPVYPHMYLQSDISADLVRLARKINKEAPARSVRLVADRLGGLQGKNILISGLSYRTGVKEAAFSGAIDLYQVLSSMNANVHLVDELFAVEEVLQMGYEFDANLTFDALFINSGSREFQVSLLGKLSIGAIVMDGRSILKQSDWGNLTQIGEGFLP